MSIRHTRSAHGWIRTIPSLLLLAPIALAGCGFLGDDEVTPYEAAKAEFDEASKAAVADGMVPSVPSDYVVLGFTHADSGVYKTSYLRPKGAGETLELEHTATVCVGDDRGVLEEECGSRTETGSFEVRETAADRYLLVFPEGALTDPVTVSDSDTSLVQAFDRGWELWAPEAG